MDHKKRINGTRFTKAVIQWGAHHGRTQLPWIKNPSAYHVWISEIMLQQTQVKTALPYYMRFIKRFPDVASLATGIKEDVLTLWSGLGYYARAHRLHAAANIIMQQHRGMMPKDIKTWISLPGIGRSTAGAIMSLAYNQPVPILDANVKRILIRFYGIENITLHATKTRLWRLAQINTPTHNAARYGQAIMDLGALVCLNKKPKCSLCPIALRCQTRKKGLPIYLHRNKQPIKAWHINMAIIRSHQNNLFFTKRSISGIWGGLWCFPVYEQSFPNLAIQLKQDFNLNVSALEKGKMLQHKLTHRTIYITPYYGQHSGKQRNQDKWIHPAELNHTGIPTPVKHLVQQRKS